MFDITNLKPEDKFYCVEGLELLECEVVSNQNKNILEVNKKNLYKNTYKKCCMEAAESSGYFQFRKEAELIHNRNVTKFLLEICNMDTLMRKLYDKAFENKNGFSDMVNAVLYKEVLDEITYKN